MAPLHSSLGDTDYLKKEKEKKVKCMLCEFHLIKEKKIRGGDGSHK